MIINKDSSYIVIDTDTKEIISAHSYVDEYTRKKAMDAAKASNDAWKESKA